MGGESSIWGGTSLGLKIGFVRGLKTDLVGRLGIGRWLGLVGKGHLKGRVGGWFF